jgi:glycosyltransferase involved in cell wall biosynthesis
MTRVLFLTCHLPYPPLSGGRLRELELLKRLVKRFQVEVCAVTKTLADDVRHAATVEQLGAAVTLFAAEPAECDERVPQQVQRHRSAAVAAYLAHAVEGFDLVHLEGFYLMDLLPDPCPVPTVLVEQNIEHRLWLQRAEWTRNSTRMEHLREFARTRHAERRAWGSATRCAVLTEDDQQVVAALEPSVDVTLVPDGVDHIAAVSPRGPSGPPSLVLVGNFSYEPNVDAARFLCDEILPLVTEVVPEARLTLVGNSGPPELARLAGPHVTLTGTVPEVEPYLDEAHVVVVPLRVGGGVKVKVLDALRRGKAIVTTSVGAQGLAGVDACVRREDQPDRFAQALVEVLTQPQERRRLERAAQEFSATLPTWDESAAKLAALWTRTVALASDQAAVSFLTPS